MNGQRTGWELSHSLTDILVCIAGLYIYIYIQELQHLNVQGIEIESAAEFDGSMGTQKGADLMALELCRGSSGDVEASLEKST